MKTNVRKIRKKRIYSEAFKKELVSLFESGQYSVPQLEKLYGVTNNNIYGWIYKYSTFNQKGARVVEMKDSHTNKLKELENKVKQLEQIVGQKQIKIDYLEKMIAIADEELKIDIKKNSDTLQSGTLKKTEKK